MYFSEFLPDAKKAFGTCTNDELFRRTTDAVRLLSNKGILDPNLGWVDICNCNHCITLPRDVDTVLGVNVGGQPSLIRDQWFQWHINGPGSGCTPCGYTDELGQFSTYRDPEDPVYLVAVVETAQDNNKEIRVFGWDDNGKRIYTAGPNNTLEDGFIVPTIYGFPGRNPDAPAIARIDRVKKAVTTGFIKLLAVDTTNGDVQTQIGYYEPTETDPQYRRIRVPSKSWVRLKYKKKNYEIRGINDWINIDNRLALYHSCRAVKLQMDDKYDLARASLAEAVQLINDEAESKRPSGPVVPQIITDVYSDGSPNLIYDNAGGVGYGYNW